MDAVCFALVFGQQFAVDDALEGGSASLLGLLQVLQVVMGLTHPRLLPLLPAPEKQPGTLMEEAACTGKHHSNIFTHYHLH